ncbi:glycosyltransferase [Clostridium butyricum]|uniref:glycosyltransferase family 2 protein n=1 Tax=Clostridium butyricum TaxID=1492 RepID=UPI003D358128
MNKKISVVMPVYNGEAYLKDSIESILNQTYTNFEFIIINDGSNDDTGKIIREYMKNDNRIILLERKNKGLVKSLNEGISLASGDYIARMDADDISDKERFRKQVNFFKYNKDVDILGSYIKIFGNEERANKIETWFNQKWNKEDMLTRSLGGSIIAHPTAMIKKSVFNKLVGYSNKYSRLEDDDLWVRAIKEGYIIDIVDEYLLKYRVHTESKSIIDASDLQELLNEKIKFKLENFFDYSKNTDKDIYIWGCGEGGKIVATYFEKIGMNFIGFIDSYKQGTFQNKPIYNKEILRSIKRPYIFIATEIGLDAVKLELSKMKINDYMFIL